MKVDSISDLGDWCPRLAVGRLGKVCHHANRFEQLHQEPSKVTGGREDRMKRGGRWLVQRLSASCNIEVTDA